MRTSHRVTRAVVTATATASAILVAAVPSSAASVREPITGHDPFVSATCAGGEEIIASVEDGFVIQRETDTGFAMHLSYTIASTLSTTGEKVLIKGATHLVGDFEAGTITMTGNDRTYTQPGEGWVWKAAGRLVTSAWDPAEPPLFVAGPKVDGYTAAQQCGLFGLDA